MLKLSNPDLPAVDQGFAVTKNRLFQLYSDLDVRDTGGIIAKIARGSGVDLTTEFTDLALSGYRQVESPTELLGDRLWLRSLEMGVYSRANISGVNALQVIQSSRYRALDATFDVVITAPDITPTKVSSLGYVYEAGTGESQWEYADPLLTIHTTISSQIQPNQTVIIEGEYQLTVPEPSLQILSFQVEKDDLILGVDLLGISFTPAFDVFSPQSGDFTVSVDGILNLYVPIGVLLPEITPRKKHRVSTGALTYSRLVS